MQTKRKLSSKTGRDLDQVEEILSKTKWKKFLQTKKKLSSKTGCRLDVFDVDFALQSE